MSFLCPVLSSSHDHAVCLLTCIHPAPSFSVSPSLSLPPPLLVLSVAEVNKWPFDMEDELQRKQHLTVNLSPSRPVPVPLLLSSSHIPMFVFPLISGDLDILLFVHVINTLTGLFALLHGFTPLGFGLGSNAKMVRQPVSRRLRPRQRGRVARGGSACSGAVCAGDGHWASH